jgi:hypothetical protein
VIERAVIDVQRGGIHARRARARLLESDDFLLVAERARSGDPKTLRKHIGIRLNHLSRRLNRRSSRRITVLTAPEEMPLSQIVERIKRAAHAVF